MRKFPTAAFVAFYFALSSFLFSQEMPGWEHRGVVAVLTTPEGADLPEGATVEDFPLLVRLNQDFFDFSQAKPGGEDIRFSLKGTPLAYQIEEWDAKKGVASIWVRVPVIRGNARQELTLHWGNAGAETESNGNAVFNETNGYAVTMHLSDAANPVKDETGNLSPVDKGTEPSPGAIGTGRRFESGQGIAGGEEITNLPKGSGPFSTSVWVRPEKVNGRIVGWGNEQAQGKAVMSINSPPHIRMDCYFSNGNVRGEQPVPMSEWSHVTHTYRDGESQLYLNGELDIASVSKGSPLNIRNPARLWLGGWYNRYDFVGEIDEVRISNVVRSAEWVKLAYENQKANQTVTGMLARPGSALTVSPEALDVEEGQSATFVAEAGGAEKVTWILKRGDKKSVVATDRFSCKIDAGRVTGDMICSLQFKAIYPDTVKTRDIPITIRDTIPEPQISLESPPAWNGRDSVEVVPVVKNLDAMKAAGGGELRYQWAVAGGAVIKKVAADRLILQRSQFTGPIEVTAMVDNGGAETRARVSIEVTEPESDPWITRKPSTDEMPQDGQFYARDDTGLGTLYCNGTLDERADGVFLKLYAGDDLVKTETGKVGTNNVFALSTKLKAGLIKYRIEFGAVNAGNETVLHTAEDLVCGDAYLIDGQSNALATDTREDSPRVTNEWVRSYARSNFYKEGETQNLWCKPVWKAGKEHKAELGWWGMQLAGRLVESQQVPIFMINGAAGGTRIDQHQRNEADPTDLTTIYGRMLWRVREAKLTHGIRAILWHQGENDQGAAGPDGGYGWESYQKYFVEMSAAWKRDFPNVNRYYVFQIYPNACSMGGGNGDMLREVQRTLPGLYSNMEVISTLGITPPGGCHYPLEGWTKFADLVQPLIERDFYGRDINTPITAPNLRHAFFTSDAKDEIGLEFDQAVIWDDALITEFSLDGTKGQVASGSVEGNVLKLKLKENSSAEKITYLHEMSWSQQRLIWGANGIAALTFCEVPIHSKN